MIYGERNSEINDRIMELTLKHLYNATSPHFEFHKVLPDVEVGSTLKFVHKVNSILIGDIIKVKAKGPRTDYNMSDHSPHFLF
jgi:hypothetical protein